MKKVLSILLTALMLGAVLIGCGESKNAEVKNVPASEITKAITDEVEFPAMGSVPEETVKEQFGLNLDDIEDYSVLKCMRSPGVGILAVVKAKDGKVDTVKSALENSVKTLKASAFYPGEAEVYDAAKVKADGNYVILAAVESTEEGKDSVAKSIEIFENKLK